MRGRDDGEPYEAASALTVITWYLELSALDFVYRPRGVTYPRPISILFTISAKLSTPESSRAPSARPCAIPSTFSMTTQSGLERSTSDRTTMTSSLRGSSARRKRFLPEKPWLSRQYHICGDRTASRSDFNLPSAQHCSSWRPATWAKSARTKAVMQTAAQKPPPWGTHPARAF